MNTEQNVEGLNVSPAIAKPMLPEGWIYTHIELPQPLQTVWISNGKGWTTLGCRSPLDADGNWCWCETNGIIYEHDRNIVSECEEDDLDVVVWHPLPVTPAFR